MRRLGIARLEPWLRALDETRHVASAAAGSQPLGPPRLLPAGSQVQPPETPPSWIGVGDAASTFDPVSGQGIVKALRSGIFASYAVADWLLRGDAAGLDRYGAFPTHGVCRLPADVARLLCPRDALARPPVLAAPPGGSRGANAAR